MGLHAQAANPALEVFGRGLVHQQAAVIQPRRHHQELLDGKRPLIRQGQPVLLGDRLTGRHVAQHFLIYAVR